MPIEIDASMPVDNLQGGSQGGRHLPEREGLRRAVMPTVTNISAYVSILSSLIMGRGIAGGWGSTRLACHPKLSRNHSSFPPPSLSSSCHPLPGAEVNNTHLFQYYHINVKVQLSPNGKT